MVLGDKYSNGLSEEKTIVEKLADVRRRSDLDPVVMRYELNSLLKEEITIITLSKELGDQVVESYRTALGDESKRHKVEQQYNEYREELAEALLMCHDSSDMIISRDVWDGVLTLDDDHFFTDYFETYGGLAQLREESPVVTFSPDKAAVYRSGVDLSKGQVVEPLVQYQDESLTPGIAQTSRYEPQYSEHMSIAAHIEAQKTEASRRPATTPQRVDGPGAIGLLQTYWKDHGIEATQPDNGPSLG